MNETNQGYEIITAETYSTTRLGQESRVVLGRMETKYGVRFVTWECTRWPLKWGRMKSDYYWGHYFDDETQARADFHFRLFEKYGGKATRES